ncbi:MAG: hypothetical protein MJZ97_03465 [Bacteroidales bacterium]|nr:hypothetical protein [Bacteroidales bacterium]
MKRIVGRTDEINSLSEYMASGRAEFVALYGRRRVGKTFLVTSYFDNKFAFDTTGVIGGDKKEELKAFCTSLAFYGYDGKQPKSWMDAFAALRTLLEKRRKKGRCVVFIENCLASTRRNRGLSMLSIISGTAGHRGRTISS